MNSLRAFDAVTRHESFARAAEELCVTVPALSVQIKNLEEELGRPLFERLHNRIELTEEGKYLFDGVGEGFRHIRSGWAYVTGMAPPQMIRITTMQSLVSGWFAKSMREFWERKDGLVVEIDTTMQKRDLSQPSYDLAIRYDYDKPQSHFQRRLHHDWLTPMMTPEIAARIKRPEDLLQEILIGCREIDFSIGIIPWMSWFRIAQIKEEPKLGPQFSDTNHTLQLAADGGGVALGRAFLALSHLEDGRLVAPFKLAIRPRVFFWLACPKGREDNEIIRDLMEHISREVDRMSAFETGRIFVDVHDGVAQPHNHKIEDLMQVAA